eukprot:jgi/Mesvir1/26881/Mv20616-RA.1
MVSASAAKKKAAKQAALDKKFGRNSESGSDAPSAKGSTADLKALESLSVADAVVDPTHASAEADKFKAARTVTGVLTSRQTARDIKIDGFSMSISGTELIQDCSIELTVGRRYGLIGQNGSGKTNFLQCLALREVPIPAHMDIYHLREEAEPSDMTALEAVVDYIKTEIANLEKLEDKILTEVGPEDERLEAIYARLEELDPTTFEAKASELLYGLGFTKKMMAKPTKDMSGGWRMRVSLARALFCAPTLLLLDEPTNHLDLEACVWLEEYLKTYKKCLIIISHSQDFLNGVCTHTIWLTQKKLTYYTGNYDTFCKTVAENEVIQMKKYQKEQDDIKHLKQFISSCGTYSNLVKQAKSKQKILDKMEDYLYENLNLGVDCDSRIALVGPNGAGKSTLIKLMAGDLVASEGTVQRHSKLVMGRYHQHSVDQLDNNLTVLEFFQKTYPNTPTFTRDLEGWRSFIGRYGVSGRLQTSLIGALSDGQKSRIVFAMICMSNPNMLLMDEPTNHLDIEAIDSLAEAIRKYQGGLVLVSHDFRLIDQVANEIWVCDKKKVEVWKEGIRAYKAMLAKKVMKHV